MDYIERIQHPINFGMIKRKMKAKMYPSSRDFISDMHLCFQNCIDYNGRRSEFGKSAVKLMKYFNKELGKAQVEGIITT